MKRILLAVVILLMVACNSTPVPEGETPPSVTRVNQAGEVIGAVESVICYSNWLANLESVFWNAFAAIVPFAQDVENTCVVDEG